MSSKRLRAAMSDEGEELSIDMSPMIDMVFLLLIFFLVNATMIIVKQDPEVEPPIAKNAKKPETGNGRIVINVREDGDFTNEEQDLLEDDDQILEYIEEAKDRIDGLGYAPKLHLRGDKDAVFKHSRRVIRLSAQAGVDQVVFSTFAFDAY